MYVCICKKQKWTVNVKDWIVWNMYECWTRTWTCISQWNWIWLWDRICGPELKWWCMCTGLSEREFVWRLKQLYRCTCANNIGISWLHPQSLGTHVSLYPCYNERIKRHLDTSLSLFPCLSNYQHSFYHFSPKINV